jgi:hypothetical protein
LKTPAHRRQNFTSAPGKKTILSTISQLSESNRRNYRVVTRIIDQQRQFEMNCDALKRESSTLTALSRVTRRSTGQPCLPHQRDRPIRTLRIGRTKGAKIATGIVVLGVASDGPVVYVCKDLQMKFRAGNIKKKVAESSAEVAGRRKLDQALQAVYNIVADT